MGRYLRRFISFPHVPLSFRNSLVPASSNMSMMNGAGRVLSPGEVIEEDLAPQTEAEYRPQLAIKLVCPECQLDPPNLIEE